MRKIAGIMVLALLGGCASTPEYRMIPTGDHGVGVRFSAGNAAMVSNGPAGSVMLLPVRYNASRKLYFVVAAFNASGDPINFGAEDVQIRLDNGQAIRMQDFNYLRQEAKHAAQQEMAAAWVSAGIEAFVGYREARGNPQRQQVAIHRASQSFARSSMTIEQRLMRTIAERGRLALQTTTIDPGAFSGGFIFADQLAIPEGMIRQIAVEVNFGGAAHLFTIALAPSGTEASVPTGIPAVPAQTMQALQRIPESWRWTDGPPRHRYENIEVVE